MHIVGGGLNTVAADVDVIPRKEPFDTGLFDGGELSFTPALTVHIAAGSGCIVNATSNPTAITASDVTWSATDLTITPSATDITEVQNIYIDSTGTAYAVPVQNEAAHEFQSAILLGWVELSNNAIVGVVSAPHVCGQKGSYLHDLSCAVSSDAKVEGLRVLPAATGLSVYVSSGRILIDGIAWHSNPSNPNVIDIAQSGAPSAPVTLNFFDHNSTAALPPDTTLPKLVDSSGTIVALTGNQATIHYVFLSMLGISVQLGQTIYSDASAAFRALDADRDNFVFAAGAGIHERSFLIAQIVLSGAAQDFSDSSLAKIVSLVNGERGNTISPIDLTRCPQYLLNAEAAEDITAGDLLSMDVNGHMQVYPATGGEMQVNYTADTVIEHAAVFLDSGSNRGVIAWRTGNNGIKFECAQGNNDGTITFSPSTTLSLSGVSSFALCRIDSTRFGFVWCDSGGVKLGVGQINGTGSAPSISGTKRTLTSAAGTCCDVVWDSSQSNLIGVYCTGGTAYNRYCKISGISVSSPPESSVPMCSGTQCRCTTAGNNVIVVTVSGTTSYWREARWRMSWFSGSKYSDMTGTASVSNCSQHCGLQVSGSTIFAQFESGGTIRTYSAAYTSGRTMYTPTQYSTSMAGKSADLVKTSSGAGYSIVLRDDNRVEVFEGNITGQYESVYVSTFTVFNSDNRLRALMFGSLFAIGIGYTATSARKVFIIDANATRTDHFIAVAPEDVPAGQRGSFDLALPLITLPRDYPVGMLYSFGPYKYQVVAHNQAVVILEATQSI